MKRLLLAALSLVLLAAAPGLQAAPQPAPGGKLQVLLLPLTLDFESQNGFKDLDAAKFYQMLEQKTEAASPSVDIVLPPAGDPRLASLDLTQEPEASAAVVVAQKFGASLVAWSKVGFRLQHQVTQVETAAIPEQQMQVGDPAPQNLITVGGVAHMGIVDAETGKVLLQGPVAIFRSGLTRASEDMDEYEEAVHDVTFQCADDLATRILEVARTRHAPR